MRAPNRIAVAAAAAVLVSTLTPMTASAFQTPFRPSVGVIVVWAGAVSVIGDAMYIAATQCREMTPQEAATATLLPGVGGIYNSTLPPTSHCGR